MIKDDGRPGPINCGWRRCGQAGPGRSCAARRRARGPQLARIARRRDRIVGRPGLAHDHVAAVGNALQRFGADRFGADRPRRREQEALSEAHVIVEEIDDHALALDLLRDQVDTEAAQKIGQIGGMDVGGCIVGLEQQAAGHLDVAEAAVRELARLDAQVL